MGGKYIRASAGSDPLQLSSHIYRVLKEKSDVTVSAVGASAVNQAVKSIIIARGKIALSGKDMVVRPGFTNSYGGHEDDEITVVIFRCRTI